MSQAIDINGFEQKYQSEPDPWGVLRQPDEQKKCDAIVEAVAKGDCTHVLELGCGIGGHSVALAEIAETLDCIDAAPTGVARTRDRLMRHQNARVHQLILPGPLPGSAYTAIVISELLYYLSETHMVALAKDVRRALATTGELVLAHHYARFADAQQCGATIHRDFAEACRTSHWRCESIARTRNWRVERFTRLRRPKLSANLDSRRN